MFCSNCGTKMGNEAKFCPDCGQANQMGDGLDQHAEMDSGSVKGGSASIQDNQFVQKSKVISQSYFGVFKDQLKSPFYQARETEDTKMTNGLISILLFALAVSMTTYFIAQNSTGGFVDIPFFTTVSSMFFGIGVMLFLISGVIFVTLKLMSVEAGFSVLINRIGSLLAASVAISLTAMVLSVIQMTFLANLLLGLASLSATISVFTVIFSYEREKGKGLDPFYGSFVAGIGTAIVFFIIVVTILGSVVNNLQNNFYW